MLEPLGAERRVAEYILNVRVSSVAGCDHQGGGATFEVIFKGAVTDPFVPSDAMGLRLWTVEEGGSVLVRSCWVGAERAPAVCHPELPAGRLRVRMVTQSGAVLETRAQVVQG